MSTAEDAATLEVHTNVTVQSDMMAAIVKLRLTSALRCHAITVRPVSMALGASGASVISGFRTPCVMSILMSVPVSRAGMVELVVTSLVDTSAHVPLGRQEHGVRPTSTNVPHPRATTVERAMI